MVDLVLGIGHGYVMGHHHRTGIWVLFEIPTRNEGIDIIGQILWQIDCIFCELAPSQR